MTLDLFLGRRLPQFSVAALHTFGNPLPGLGAHRALLAPCRSRAFGRTAAAAKLASDLSNLGIDFRSLRFESFES